MKEIVQYIFTSPIHARAIVWGKLLTITGAAQILVQVVSLLAGILVIRLLPTQEYALYTLANTMLGTMVILADGGIATGVMAEGRKVWQDREQLGVVLATGLDLRKKFAIGSFVVAMPALFYLLRSHGASWIMSGLIIAGLIPGFTTALSGALLHVAPKLQQDIAPLQKNQVAVNLARLILLSITLFTFPLAFVAILSAGLPQIWSNMTLRKISAPYAALGKKPDPVVRSRILHLIKRVLPTSIYFCLAGQITIWMTSILGTTTDVAQVGALGRVAISLGLFTVLFTTLITPRFARMPDDNSKLLLNRYLHIQLSLLLLCFVIIGVVWLLSNKILWVLGNEFTHLKTELMLSVTNGCLALLSAASHSIFTSKGWIIHPAIYITCSITAIVCGLFLFKINTLKGILTLNIFVTSTEVVLYFTYTLARIRMLASEKHTQQASIV